MSLFRRTRAAAARRTAIAPCLALTLSLTACGHKANDTRSATTGLPNVLQQLTANPWILNQGASALPVIVNTPITIRFGNRGVLSGTSPCGTYQAHFTVVEETIKIHNIGRPAGACSPRALTAERAYLTTLGSVNKVAPTGRDHLKLEGRANTKLSYDINNVH